MADLVVAGSGGLITRDVPQSFAQSLALNLWCPVHTQVHPLIRADVERLVYTLADATGAGVAWSPAGGSKPVCPMEALAWVRFDVDTGEAEEHVKARQQA